MTDLDTCRMRLANGWTVSVSSLETPPAICNVAAWPSTLDGQRIPETAWFDFGDGKKDVRCFSMTELRKTLQAIADAPHAARPIPENAEFDELTQGILRQISAALEMPYETLVKKFAPPQSRTEKSKDRHFRFAVEMSDAERGELLERHLTDAVNRWKKTTGTDYTYFFVHAAQFLADWLLLLAEDEAREFLQAIAGAHGTSDEEIYKAACDRQKRARLALGVALRLKAEERATNDSAPATPPQVN